jgi:hypothetical protein
MPVITPVEESRLSPSGSDPARADHVYGEIPPFADSVAEYGVSRVAAGSEVLVTSGASRSVPVRIRAPSFGKSCPAPLAVQFDGKGQAIELNVDTPVGRLSPDQVLPPVFVVRTTPAVPLVAMPAAAHTDSRGQDML